MFDGPAPTPFLALIDAALVAGEAILDVYGRETIAVASKADASPVTEADTRAEEIILVRLRRSLPGVPIVAEEEAAAGRLPADIGNRFILVDPLDGTREFTARNGEFTVNIAIVENGRPVMGVVYAPALGVLYAGADAAAVKAEVVDGTLAGFVDIAARPMPERGALAVVSRSHSDTDTEIWLQESFINDRVSAGSSLKFCLIAEGAADVYPRLGRTMEWDTAAGDAILSVAGGRVETLDGKPLMYGKRGRPGTADFANPSFVAYGARRQS